MPAFGLRRARRPADRAPPRLHRPGPENSERPGAEERDQGPGAPRGHSHRRRGHLRFQRDRSAQPRAALAAAQRRRARR
ncbi:MAG: hypothetical protein DME02_07870, partial [Candidatus Rokuibacteriota bacterium]